MSGCHTAEATGLLRSESGVETRSCRSSRGEKGTTTKGILAVSGVRVDGWSSAVQRTGALRERVAPLASVTPWSSAAQRTRAIRERVAPLSRGGGLIGQ